MDGIPLPDEVPPAGPPPEDVHVLFQPPSQAGKEEAAGPVRKKGSVDGDGVETLWPPPPPPPHLGYNYQHQPQHQHQQLVPPGYLMPPMPAVDYGAYYAQYYQVDSEAFRIEDKNIDDFYFISSSNSPRRRPRGRRRLRRD